jgi:hypothetical protein
VPDPGTWKRLGKATDPSQWPLLFGVVVKEFLPMLIIGVVAVVGCNQQIAPSNQLAYPPPNPINPGVTPLSARTPILLTDSSSGVITGRLIRDMSGLPLPGVAIYIADLVPLTPGPGNLITIQQKSSVHTTTDANGYFGLIVKPGDYALVLWTPIRSMVIPDPQHEDKELLVTVEAGKTDDMGEIVVNFP